MKVSKINQSISPVTFLSLPSTPPPAFSSLLLSPANSWPPWILSSFFSIQKTWNVLFRSPIPVPHILNPGNSLKAVSWDNSKFTSFVSHLPEITLLCCPPLPTVWKPLFQACGFLFCFRSEGTSSLLCSQVEVYAIYFAYSIYHPFLKSFSPFSPGFY